MRTSSAFCMIWLILILLTGAVAAEEAIQTDWSGGPGVAGPQRPWQDRFDASRAIDWSGAPGALHLLTAMPAEHTVTSTFGEPAGVAAADLDGDTDLDIVSVAFQGHAVAWWENDGTGGGWIEHPIAGDFHGACSIHCADLDGDTDIDVAATAEESNAVAWWENDGTGGGWTEHVVDPSIGMPFSICAGDYDRDNDPDLCSAAFGAGDIVWYENTDVVGHTWVRHDIDINFPGAWWARSADMDDDQDPDVVACSYYLHDVVWYENDGSGGTWTQHTIDASFASPVNLRVVDLDGDFDPDVLAVSYAGSIAWWENIAGGWTKHVIAAELDHPFSCRAADLDNDGDPDVIGNERDANRVLWWENVDALGTLWLTHVVDETCSGPNDVLAADLDGDALDDVIATYSWDNTIAWYKDGDDYAASGWLESTILDLGEPVLAWGAIDWQGTTPPATATNVLVRASSDPQVMGPWTQVAFSGDDLSA